jgi:hypothetical protein
MARTGDWSEIACILEQSYFHGVPCVERAEIVHLTRTANEDICVILA